MVCDMDIRLMDGAANGGCADIPATESRTGVLNRGSMISDISIHPAIVQ